MINVLLEIDRSLFITINHLPHNFFTDSFFTFLTGVGFWGAIWFVIVIFLFIWEEVKDKKGFFALLLAVVSSQVIVEWILKNLISRPRPQFVIPATILVVDLARSFSFPSGHATVAFAGAYILAQEHKRWALWYYILASLIAFSRIYLGKHYPSDVLAGAILGILIGFTSLKIINLIFARFKYN